ncbi:hypothetical protein [Stenoxybacter acetivorans]|uniref:hypothetical protein n=1 Tax=Stenoxybacter acetivorans TaxID=422441 RepID=UPI0012EBCE74|nr:hypothetical protein [Stenoxybacter acetivorans]
MNQELLHFIVLTDAICITLEIFCLFWIWRRHLFSWYCRILWHWEERRRTKKHHRL